MPKILLAECKQEVSSFNPVASHYGDFIVDRGQGLLAYHRKVRNEMGGALSVFDAQPDLELVPALSAVSTSLAETTLLLPLEVYLPDGVCAAVVLPLLTVRS